MKALAFLTSTQLAAAVAIATLAPPTQMRADISLFDHAFNLDGSVAQATDPLPANVNGAGFNFTSGIGSIEFSYSSPGLHYGGLFLDHEIDELDNTFFNEIGSTHYALAPGQSWEIDEPGFALPPGDIYDHFQAGTLSNSVDIGQDDVSM